MLPLAEKSPVGSIDVPPLMVTVPSVEVSAPAPEYAPVGFIKMDPAEVVTGAVCVIAPPKTV